MAFIEAIMCNGVAAGCLRTMPCPSMAFALAGMINSFSFSECLVLNVGPGQS